MLLVMRCPWAASMTLLATTHSIMRIQVHVLPLLFSSFAHTKPFQAAPVSSLTLAIKLGTLGLEDVEHISRWWSALGKNYTSISMRDLIILDFAGQRFYPTPLFSRVFASIFRTYQVKKFMTIYITFANSCTLHRAAESAHTLLSSHSQLPLPPDYSYRLNLKRTDTGEQWSRSFARWLDLNGSEPSSQSSMRV